jgi:hypothetical protein
MKNELLYSWVASGFHVLVPKKRGEGYLKQPYGHHHNEALTEIGNSVGCDLCGLDGSLEFDGPDTSRLYHGNAEAKAAFVARVIPRLEAYYQMPSREVDERTFLGCHPTPH